MIPGFVTLLLTTVLVPLFLDELRDWCPLLAQQLVRWAARRLGDSAARARYEEEWVANIGAVPGKISQLVSALGYLVALPAMLWTVRRARREVDSKASPSPSKITTMPGQATRHLIPGHSLSAFWEGEMSAADHDWASQHIIECSKCRVMMPGTGNIV
ncbi:MAG TPA: hypothetical protein VGN81_10720 [Pseudonocardiaceae bacterium]|jgi:hypothetical protein